MSKLRCGFSETILGPNPDPLRTQPILRAVCVFYPRRDSRLYPRCQCHVCSHSETRRVCSSVDWFTDLLGLNIKIITRRYVLLVHSLPVLFINHSYSKISPSCGNIRKDRLLHKKYQQCSNLPALPGQVGQGVSIVHCTRASPCYVALRNARFNVFHVQEIETAKHYYYVIMFKWNMF